MEENNKLTTEEIKTETEEVFPVTSSAKERMLKMAQFGAYFFAGETSLEVDFSDSRGGAVYVTGRLEVPINIANSREGFKLKSESLQTKNAVIPMIDEENETIELEVSERSRRSGGYSANFYTRDTVSLVQSKLDSDALILFFEVNPEIKEAILVSSAARTYIGKAPKEVIGLLDGNNLSDKKFKTQTHKSQEQYEKDDLKVYETPSDVFTVLFSSIDKNIFKRFAEFNITEKIKQAAYNRKSVYEELVSVAKSINNIEFKIKQAIRYEIGRIALRHGDDVIDKTLGEDLTPSAAREYAAMIEAMKKHEGITAMLGHVDTLFEKGMNGEGFMKQLANGHEAFKEVFGFTPYKEPLLVFDPQIGSGAGMLGGFDASNFHGIAKGLELRENIRYEDSRIEAIGGVNTSVFASALKGLFCGNTTANAADNLFSYLNPPYTADDSVARETIGMYRNGMVISGLFPVKMKSFLNNNLSKNSIIMEIPRHLTGYTDPKTPDRFLFILGEKYSFDAHMKENSKENNKNLFGEYKHEEPFWISLKEDATAEKFKRAIDIYFIGRGNSVRNKLLGMVSYYGEMQTRSTLLFSRMETMITKQRAILKNAEKLNEGLELNKGKVFNIFAPLEVAKTKKIFIDPRFYSEEGIYDRYSFKEIYQNVPLLVYYRDNMPSIFNLIVQIAEEKNIEIPIDTTPSNPFVLGEKPTGKKDVVTNLNLGMMKLNYYPSSIDLSTLDGKETMAELVNIVYKGQISEQHSGDLRTAIALADKMVIKMEKVLRTDSESSKIMPKEVFVLVDSYGYDICKINMELDEFYEALEQAKLFDINDYVELAKLDVGKKRKIMEGFIREMQSPIHAIAKFNDMDMMEVERKITETGAQILKSLRDKTMTMQEMNYAVLEFSEKMNITGLFRDQFKIDNENLTAKLKAIVGSSLTQIAKKMTDNIATQIVHLFDANPLKFYEDDKENTFAILQEHLLPLYNGDKQTLEEDMVTFSDRVTEELTPFYRIHSNINDSASRLAESLVYRYTSIKWAYSPELSDEHAEMLYDNHIRNMFSNTLGLLPHQINEAEGFLSLSDEKSMKHLYAEMRSGKTRTFIAMLFLLGMYKDEDITLILETANIPDITGQMMESFPFLAMNARYFCDPDKVITSEKSSFENLVHDNMYPVPYRIFTQSKVRGGGEAIKKLNETFGEDMREAAEALRGVYGEVTREKLLKDYPNSNFRKLLEFSCE